jgi:hypothetical protein
MSFPTFPVFRKLVPEDRDIYLDFYRRVEPYSDFSFNNLIIWLDLREDLEVSQFKQCIILRFTNPFEPGKAYSLIGNRDCQVAIESIFDFQESLGLEARLVMAPECVIDDMLKANALPEHLVIRASIDHRDYLFGTDQVVSLEGSKFMNLRRNLRVFHTEQPEGISVGSLDLSSPVAQEHLLTKLKEWQTQATFMKNDPLFDETKALQRHIQFNKWCPAECLGFFDHGELFGFSIFHRPPQQDWAIFNHLKCRRDVRYGFDFVFYTTVSYLHEQGVRVVNGEQDLGIIGLRTHKQQLGPNGYLYRYDITRT